MALPARLRRTLVVSAAIVTLIVLAGATYQGVATALERRRFPYPGRLVDVGGHQLHISCVGQGSPTVVLEAPVLGISSAWAAVQPGVADHTRVCAYDRAGLGWSEAGDLRYAPERVPEELHALLERAGERGPHVIAGHELGAAFAEMYAAQYPQDVAALVLIDLPEAGDRRASETRLVSASPWLARAGMLRLTNVFSRRARALPEPARGAMRAFLNRPDHLTRAADELAAWDRTIQRGSDETQAAIVRVDSGASAPGFLTGEAAERVVAALTETVRRVRAP